MSEFSREQLLEIRAYIEQAQDKLRSCYSCQVIDPEGDITWVDGIQTNVHELIAYDLEAPEEYWEEIAAFLECPLCGNLLDSDSDVGVITVAEQKIAAMWDKWQNEYSKPLSEFYEFLNKYPYLGLAHALGAEIHRTVSAFPESDIEARVGYRARSIGDPVRTSLDMTPPDPTVVKINEGRFNHFGQGVCYLANSELGAAKEVLELEGDVWLQKFRIKNATRIMDLTVNPEDDSRASKNLLTFGLVYGRNLSEWVERQKGWKPEYFVPRFIADCAKNEGFNGIKYKSSRHWLENLVLFSWDKLIEPLGDPFIYKLKREDTDDQRVRTILDVFDEKYHDILNPLVGPFLPGLEPWLLRKPVGEH